MNTWTRRITWFGGIIVVLFTAIAIPRLAPRFIHVIRYQWMIESNPYHLDDGQEEYLKSTYGKIAREELYRSIPRALVPEMEPVLEEFLPFFEPIPGLNLSDVFSNPGMDRKLQVQANSSNLTAKDFHTLNFYESVRTAHDYTTPRGLKKRLEKYAKYKLPKRSGGLFGPNNEWSLASGRLVHKTLMEEDVPWYWWPLTWFDSSYQMPTQKRFYQKYHVRVTGLFYYPPGGYAEWHTNRYDIHGWRFYYIKTTEPGHSWFRYKHAQNDTIHLAPDGAEHYNMFYLTGNEDDLVWHSVYSDTDRWSVGFNVPPMFAYLILARLHNDTNFPIPSS